MSDSASRDMHGVAGKVIIVTGAGRGVGKGMAVHLGKGGANVVVAEWKPDLLEAAVAELDGLGVTTLGVRCNVMERDEIEAMVAATVERFGRVDGLINNAQTFRPLSPVAEVSEDDIDVFYRSGVKGTLWAMQAVYPHMRDAGLGPHRELRVVDGHHRRQGVRRVQRVEGSGARADPHRGAGVGARRHRRQLHRTGRGRPPRRGRASRARATGSSSRTARWAARAIPRLDIGPLAWFLCSDATPLPHRPHVHGRRRRVHVGMRRRRDRTRARRVVPARVGRASRRSARRSTASSSAGWPTTSRPAARRGTLLEPRAGAPPTTRSRCGCSAGCTGWCSRATAPELARHYPSVGGDGDAAAAWWHLRDLLATRPPSCSTR